MRGRQCGRTSRAAVAATGVALLITLGGCGQQGPLFLPEEEDAAADTPTAEPGGEERDDER